MATTSSVTDSNPYNFLNGDTATTAKKSSIDEAQDRFMKLLVTQLQTQLNATQAELRVVKRMRCPRDDCPVFVKDDPVPAE